MSLILTHKYRAFLAQQFVDGLTNNDFSAYLFIGHPVEWTDTSNNAVSDSNPPIPQDNTQNIDFKYWRDMIGVKQIVAANAQYVVTRRDWANNTFYDQYDDTVADLESNNFFVIDTTTVPYRVYKCLWNNTGANSTIAPSTIGAALTPTAVSDGYVWQYMYTIGSENYRFLTNDWMPVLTDDSLIQNAQAFAGALPTAVPLFIVDGGIGYNAALTTTATIVGDGVGANIVSGGVTIQNGAVSQVLLAAGGLGYTQVTSISIAQGLVNTAIARAIIPPYPNHGADPVRELRTAAVMLIASFANSENGNVTIANDFRRTGLLINPIESVTGNIANNLLYRQTYDISFTANSGVLTPDDIVTNTTKASNPTAIVVDVVAGNGDFIARLTNVDPQGETPPFDIGDIVTCESSGASITVASATPPDLKLYSGRILYVNHRTPVLRANGQTEDIKLVFPFE